VQSEGASPLSPFMLGLYKRHALKTFRASVGDVEGHNYFRGALSGQPYYSLIKIIPNVPAMQTSLYKRPFHIQVNINLLIVS